jgi:phage repressor protein C with HTH and peptisase S24 domain
MRWPLALYRVEGDSMKPTYVTGDTLLATGWFHPRVGQVVVATRSGRPLIKRIVKLASGQVWIEGDNPEGSTDSRQFGALPVASLRARIMKKL